MTLTGGTIKMDKNSVRVTCVNGKATISEVSTEKSSNKNNEEKLKPDSDMTKEVEDIKKYVFIFIKEIR